MSELAATTPATSAAIREARVRDAVAEASRRTSVDFDYLLAQARVESSLDSGARASTSSAAGLFQFIESTWLQTLHRHGREHGLGDAASRISMTSRGAQVFDPRERAAILAMRHDPQVASLMAGALARDNREVLLPVLGRDPDASELYLAHFLGAGGAARFLAHLQDSPGSSAPALFPRPAAANRAIFYGNGGQPRSLEAVMSLIEGKIGRAMHANGSDPLGPEGRTNEPRIATLPTLPIANRWSDWPRVASISSDTALQPAPARRRAMPPAMSSILRDSLGGGDARSGNQLPGHVREAYGRLRSLGL